MFLLKMIDVPRRFVECSSRRWICRLTNHDWFWDGLKHVGTANEHVSLQNMISHIFLLTWLFGWLSDLGDHSSCFVSILQYRYAPTIVGKWPPSSWGYSIVLIYVGMFFHYIVIGRGRLLLLQERQACLAAWGPFQFLITDFLVFWLILCPRNPTVLSMANPTFCQSISVFVWFANPTVSMEIRICSLKSLFLFPQFSYILISITVLFITSHFSCFVLLISPFNRHSSTALHTGRPCGTAGVAALGSWRCDDGRRLCGRCSARGNGLRWQRRSHCCRLVRISWASYGQLLLISYNWLFLWDYTFYGVLLV